MKDFAKPAMSGLITIKAGPKQIQFGPAKSLPQILSMKAIDGPSWSRSTTRTRSTPSATVSSTAS